MSGFTESILNFLGNLTTSDLLLVLLFVSLQLSGEGAVDQFHHPQPCRRPSGKGSFVAVLRSGFCKLFFVPTLARAVSQKHSQVVLYKGHTFGSSLDTSNLSRVDLNYYQVFLSACLDCFAPGWAVSGVSSVKLGFISPDLLELDIFLLDFLIADNFEILSVQFNEKIPCFMRISNVHVFFFRKERMGSHR